MFAAGNYHFTQYSYANLVAAAIAFIVVLAAWPRRKDPSARYLILLEISSAIWGACNFFEAAAVTIDLKVLWSQISYFGIVSTPLFFALLALEYSGHHKLLNRRNLLLAGLFPAVTLLIVFTNNLHHFHWSTVTINPINKLAIYGRGPWFWIFTAYSYLMVFTGVLTLGWSVYHFADHYRFQIAAILIGAALPFTGNLLYLSNINPIPGLDWTPITFSLTGISLMIGIFRLGILKLAPVARKQLVELMSDGMLVIDHRNVIVDFNPACKDYLSPHAPIHIGAPVQEILPSWPDAYITNGKPAAQAIEISLKHTSFFILDVRVVPLEDDMLAERGWLLVFRDISSEKQTETDLLLANRRLREQIAEIVALKERLKEDSIRDALTGAYNRRFLGEYLQEVLANAGHIKHPVSLVMLDIDRFKDFNDSYGHEAGDQTLIDIVNLIQHSSRKGDAICRYGGEEFVIVMPGASIKHAFARADGWRQDVETLEIHNQGRVLNTTVSLGVAQFPWDGTTPETLLRSADAAMYIAKQTGRNRVCLPNEQSAGEHAS